MLVVAAERFGGYVEGLHIRRSLPGIVVADIGGSHLISWTFALYEIGSVVAGAVSALLALRFGVRLPMAVAAFVFALGCAVAATAGQMWIVVVGRLFQGLGGGGLVAGAPG